MKLSPTFTTVTPFSKLIAWLMLVFLPFLGFYLGYQYKVATTIPETKIIVQEKRVASEVVEPIRNLLEICGQLPDLPIGGDDKFTQVTGPYWSPDCRHIAWATWQSGAMGLLYEGPYHFEGLFVYDFASKKTKRVYTPKVETQSQETVELQTWQNNDQLVFIKDGQRQLFSIDLNSKVVSELPKN